MKKGGFFWGVVLILLGVVLILQQQHVLDISWALLWPFAVALLGIFFHFDYFVDGRKYPGVLVPGGILLLYGALFIVVTLKGWDTMSLLWPVFILGPALGIAELTLASRGRQGSWIPVLILSVIGGFFLVQNFMDVSLGVLLAAVMIILGVFIIFRAFRRKKPHPAAPEQP